MKGEGGEKSATGYGRMIFTVFEPCSLPVVVLT